MRDHKIAIQGAQSSFHHLAAKKFYGADAKFLHCHTFAEVCRMLMDNRADYAVMAIENAISGSILANYELIRRCELRIIGEEYIPVELHVLKHRDSEAAEILTILSHPVALAQCQSFFLSNPCYIPIEDADTARCAMKVKQAGKSSVACIANTAVSHDLELDILHRNVTGTGPNHTRFLVLSRQFDPSAPANKASLSFGLDHQVGSLADVLTVFKRWNVNLSKIQSVPLEGDPFRYRFHLDVMWDKETDYRNALKRIRKITGDLCILGEYQAAPVPVDLQEIVLN